MKATIEEIRQAKKIAETQVTKILANFASNYGLHDIEVDVSVVKHFIGSIAAPYDTDSSIAVTIKTDIKVKI